MIPNSPIFTVVIPTMDRPELFKAALRTVMWQTFEDFEVIVSDNSTKDESRKMNVAAVEEYVQCPRLKYVQPDRWMNMPDHWEFATRFAVGRYVLILTDRLVMRPSALEFLHSQILRYPEDSSVVCWMGPSSFNELSGVLSTTPSRSDTEIIDSKKLLREYTKFSEWQVDDIYSNRLPRMLNSCYRSDLAQKIRDLYGRFFIPVTPDYCAAFLQLAHTDRILYVDRALFLSHGNVSNGRDALLHGSKSYVSTLGDLDAFEGTPIQIDTVINLIVRDFLSVKKLVGDRLDGVNFDMVGYYMFNYREILEIERLGSQRNLKSLYALWWSGVEKLPQQEQTRIRECVKNIDQQRGLRVTLRRSAVRARATPLLRELLGRIRYVRQRLAGEPLFADVFEAALKTNNVLTDECANKTVQK